MPSDQALRNATPMIHVPDVRAAVMWYETIGFKTVSTYDDGQGGLTFAVISAGKTRVMLDEGGRPSEAKRREVDLYVDVDNVDELFASLRERVEVVEVPHDTFYGARELIIRDLNGFWITFGQMLQETPVTSADDAHDQLVLEVIVRDVERSLAVYTALGFKLERRDGDFAELSWDARRLFLDQRVDLPPPAGTARANVRIMTPDVDAVWARAQSLGLIVERPIDDRCYGLRDFTVLDPDGFGLRFASPLPQAGVSPGKDSSS
jgi:uncharacterized glyoxalase superfamily protein PhnB